MAKKKSGYDETKDKLIKDLGAINDHLVAEIRQYDDGPRKVAVVKLVGPEKNGRRQLFRVSIADMIDVSKFMALTGPDLKAFEDEEGDSDD
jgi:hypothetical protein